MVSSRSNSVSIEEFVEVLLQIREHGAHGPGLQYIRRAVLEEVEEFDIVEVPAWLHTLFSSLLGIGECLDWEPIPDGNWSNVSDFLSEICDQGALHLLPSEYEDSGEVIKFHFEGCERAGAISIESGMFMTRAATGSDNST